MNDPETQAVIDIVMPFVSRERLRDRFKEDVKEYLDEVIDKIITEVYSRDR